MQDAASKSYHNDFWTLDIDQLGYGALGEKLAKSLVTCEPPFSVAVCGGWGAGKTSMLRYLMAYHGGRPLRLDPEQVFLKTPREELPEGIAGTWHGLANKAKGRAIPSVWFNPWQHQAEEHPLHALLHEIYNQFSAWAKFLSESRKLNSVAMNTGLKLLGELSAPFTVGVPVNPEHITSTGEAYEHRNYLAALDSQRFPLHFEQAVTHLVQGQKTGKGYQVTSRRLLIFVDDLDRCQPQQAYRLLEAIKLFLHTSNCVFVFGVDYDRLVRVLSHSIEDFSKLDHREAHAADYLDKMFQAVVRLPAPSQRKFIEFVAAHAPSGRDEGKLPQLLSDILEPNPRKVKNFLNSLSLFLPEDQALYPAAILVHYLRMYYREIYTVLEANPEEGLSDLHTVLTLDAGSPGTNARQAFFLRLLHNPLPDKHARVAGEANFVGVTLNPEEVSALKHQTDVFQARKRFSTNLADAIAANKLTADIFRKLA